MGQANFLWGAPRIHGELLKLGIQVAPSTVGKYLRRRRNPPSDLADFPDKSHEANGLDGFLYCALRPSEYYLFSSSCRITAVV